MGETMATNIMGTTMIAVSLLVLRPCCGAGSRVGVLFAWDAWIGVAFAVGVDVARVAELIRVVSVVMLPSWEACELLPDFELPLTVESLATLEAAESTALVRAPPTDMSGSRIGDEPVTSPLLFDERRWRREASWMSIAITVCYSTARFNKMNSSANGIERRKRYETYETEWRCQAIVCR